MLSRDFNYGAALHILMKDIDLAMEQGEELGVPMWVCQATRLLFKHAIFAEFREHGPDLHRPLR